MLVRMTLPVDPAVSKRTARMIPPAVTLPSALTLPVTLALALSWMLFEKVAVPLKVAAPVTARNAKKAVSRRHRRGVS